MEIKENLHSPTKEDIKFYRQRIYTLFKEMLKNNNFPNENWPST